MSERKDHQRDLLSNPGIERAPTGSSRVSDARIVRVADREGNASVQQRIADGDLSRDRMLDHICGRLRTMHALQQRELSLTHRGSNYDWWRIASDAGKPHEQEPRPMRWNTAARYYEDAAHHLCRGELKRGRDLLDRAMDAERVARERMTRLVDTVDLDEGPPAVGFAPPLSTEVSGACDVPDDVGLAKRIYDIDVEGPTVPNRGRPADPWWTLDEEEEEPGEPGP